MEWNEGAASAIVYMVFDEFLKISRRLDVKLLVAPGTLAPPSLIPASLMDLVAQNITWTTPQWSEQFNDILDQC